MHGGGREDRAVWDLGGAAANIGATLGDAPLGWLLPVPPSAAGSGLEYPTRYSRGL